MKIGSMFSGYGGLDLAVEAVFHATTAWHCEWEDAPSKILAHHWPGIPNYRDVTAVDWETVPPVDIITGGFPCQDVSLAGRRAGMTEGTRSNLWGAMRTAVETIQPRYVVAENVRGLLSAKATSASDMEPSEGLLGNGDNGHLRALGRVLGDLADCGYDAQWRGLRAADVGAPHGRFRVFILATRRDVATDPSGLRGVEAVQHHGRGTATLNRATVPHQPDRELGRAGSNGRATAEDSNLATRGQRWQSAPGQAEGGRSRSDAGGRDRTLAAIWGDYAPAVARWERLHGPAPAPTELTARGNQALSVRLVEWMMGLSAGWVTDVDISRNEQLKALGNGVVPAQAYAALAHMLNTRKEAA